MSLTNEEILAFVEENIVLEKVGGEIVITKITANIHGDHVGNHKGNHNWDDNRDYITHWAGTGKHEESES